MWRADQRTLATTAPADASALTAAGCDFGASQNNPHPEIQREKGVAA
jgi:hypothetical protein